MCRKNSIFIIYLCYGFIILNIQIFYGCTYEYDTPVAPGFSIGLTASYEDPKGSKFCLKNRGSGLGYAQDVCEIIQFGVSDEVVYGTTKRGWFIADKNDSREYTDKNKWIADLATLGVSSIKLRDPPTRMEALLIVVRRESIFIGGIVMGIIVVAGVIFWWRYRARSSYRSNV